MTYPADTTEALVALACGCTYRQVADAFGGSPAGWHARFDCAASDKKARYYQDNREGIISKSRARYHANPDRKRVSDRMRKYGLTRSEAENLLNVKACEICGVGLRGHGKTGRHVDHCHSTGRVRGVLCSSCNTGLGHFRDNPVALRTAALYLEKKQ